MEPSYTYLTYELPLLLVLTVVSGASAVAGGRRPELRVLGWLLLGVTASRAICGALARMELMGLRVGIPAPFTADALMWIDAALVVGVIAPSAFVLARGRLGRLRRVRYWLHRLQSWRGRRG